MHLQNENTYTKRLEFVNALVTARFNVGCVSSCAKLSVCDNKFSGNHNFVFFRQPKKI